MLMLLLLASAALNQSRPLLLLLLLLFHLRCRPLAGCCLDRKQMGLLLQYSWFGRSRLK
jgi:hypothetical protein